MSTCSTHVLDVALGRPAAGIRVHLSDVGLDRLVAEDSTDADGRVRFAADLDPGVYTVTFETGEWFAAADRSTFFPAVVLAFIVEADEHYHVPLLLSPYSYTTYRGS
ncbi:MAG: hydroxyisourate hydrolase [Nocardioides sp.]|nr:hydroxyisourate hydrolase [Nocardioides sp.]